MERTFSNDSYDCKPYLHNNDDLINKDRRNREKEAISRPNKITRKCRTIVNDSNEYGELLDASAHISSYLTNKNGKQHKNRRESTRGKKRGRKGKFFGQMKETPNDKYYTCDFRQETNILNNYGEDGKGTCDLKLRVKKIESKSDPVPNGLSYRNSIGSTESTVNSNINKQPENSPEKLESQNTQDIPELYKFEECSDHISLSPKDINNTIQGFFTEETEKSKHSVYGMYYKSMPTLNKAFVNTTANTCSSRVTSVMRNPILNTVIQSESMPCLLKEGRIDESQALTSPSKNYREKKIKAKTQFICSHTDAEQCNSKNVYNGSNCIIKHLQAKPISAATNVITRDLNDSPLVNNGSGDYSVCYEISAVPSTIVYQENNHPEILQENIATKPVTTTIYPTASNFSYVGYQTNSSSSEQIMDPEKENTENNSLFNTLENSVMENIQNVNGTSEVKQSVDQDTKSPDFSENGPINQSFHDAINSMDFDGPLVIDLTRSDSPTAEAQSRESKTIENDTEAWLKDYLQNCVSDADFTSNFQRLTDEIDYLSRQADIVYQEYNILLKRKRKREEIATIMKRHKTNHVSKKNKDVQENLLSTSTGLSSPTSQSQIQKSFENSNNSNVKTAHVLLDTKVNNVTQSISNLVNSSDSLKSHSCNITTPVDVIDNSSSDSVIVQSKKVDDVKVQSLTCVPNVRQEPLLLNFARLQPCTSYQINNTVNRSNLYNLYTIPERYLRDTSYAAILPLSPPMLVSSDKRQANHKSNDAEFLVRNQNPFNYSYVRPPSTTTFLAKSQIIPRDGILQRPFHKNMRNTAYQELPYHCNYPANYCNHQDEYRNRVFYNSSQRMLNPDNIPPISSNANYRMPKGSDAKIPFKEPLRKSVTNPVYNDASINKDGIAYLSESKLDSGIPQNYQSSNKIRYKLQSSMDNQEETQVHLNVNCVICSRPTGLLCSRCRKVRYCSKQCQIFDWNKTHSQQCGL